MAKSEKFRELLTEAIYRIRTAENGKQIGVIQDELGYALEKEGGSSIEHWRKGIVPRIVDLEKLTGELIRRGRLDREWVEIFLEEAKHPYVAGFCDQLFPEALHPPAPTIAKPEKIRLLPNKSHRTLIGRELLVAEALNALEDRSGRWIISLDGVGGIGKTALAYEIVEESLKKGLFEDILWLSPVMQGQEEQEQGSSFFFEVLLDTILYQLGISNYVELTRMEKEARVQRFLRSRRILLVLDNLEKAIESQHDIAQKLQRWLSPSKAIFTSRHRFTRETYAIHLEGINQKEAFNFIDQEAEERRIQSLSNVETAAVEQLIAVTGGSPLALKLVIGQLSHLPIHTVLKHLQEVKSFKHAMNDDLYTQLYQSIYKPSWEALSEDGKQLLIALSLFVSNVNGTVEMLQQIGGFSEEEEVLDAISELWQVSLIERTFFDVERQQFHYYIHALTQHFVIADIIQWYRRTKDKRENPFFVLYQQTLTRGIGYLMNRIRSEESEMLTINEHYLALNLLNHAFQLPDGWPILSQLLIGLAPQMERAGHRSEWSIYLEKGIEESKLRQDRQVEAELNLQLGFLLHLQSKFEAAHHLFMLSATSFESVDDRHGQARAMIRQAQACRHLGYHQKAGTLVESAFHYLEDRDVERAHGYLLQGNLAHDREEWEAAADFYRQAISLCNEKTTDRHLIARNLTNLGTTLRPQKKFEEAIDCYNQAIALLEDRLDPTHKAITFMNLGNIHFELQEPKKALTLYQKAQPIFSDTHNELQLAKVHYNSGIAHQKLKNWKEAEELYRLSLEGYQHLGKILAQIDCMGQLGLMYKEQRQYQRATKKFQEALRMLATIKDKPGYERRQKKIQQYLGRC